MEWNPLTTLARVRINSPCQSGSRKDNAVVQRTYPYRLRKNRNSDSHLEMSYELFLIICNRIEVSGEKRNSVKIKNNGISQIQTTSCTPILLPLLCMEE